ncbi:MAG TPA: response regulator transcription factor [Vicinamibacterales bacterium]|nr:response regulator transcription factor [Vicinamibacterales bacterium]
MIRLVIADDHPIVLDGLEQVLRLEPDLSVVARCTSGRATVNAVVKHRPDVLLLDLAMPEMNGLDVMRELQDRRLPTRVVLLTAQIDQASLTSARELGAAAVVLKETDSRLLVECVRTVHAGRPWSDPRQVETAAAGLVSPGALQHLAERLTLREREIVRMAAEGLRNRDIADRLFITEGTVKLHLHNIYRKLGVNGRPELIGLAARLGIG